MQQSECSSRSIDFFFLGLRIKDESCRDETHFLFCFCSTVPSFSRHVHCTILCTSAFDVGFISPSDDHSYQAAHQAVLREGKKKELRPKIKKQGGGVVVGRSTAQVRNGRRLQKASKMKIIHLSRSVWQPEAPFDNVMHTIMHAQCGGHWETLVVGGGRGEEKKHLLLCLLNLRH